jgi:hypothetical protein
MTTPPRRYEGVDKLGDQIKKLQDEQLTRQKDYDTFLANLDVE